MTGKRLPRVIQTLAGVDLVFALAFGGAAESTHRVDFIAIAAVLAAGAVAMFVYAARLSRRLTERALLEETAHGWRRS